VRALNYTFPTRHPVRRRVHVGVVGSGDLEVLLEPVGPDDDPATAIVAVRTSVEGFDEIWQATLERFFARVPVGGRWELNDAGATPALVTLRLQQAADDAHEEETP
jgi:malonate decarboxylase delta subunit